VRIVIDSKNRLTPDLAFFSEDSPIILIRNTLENDDKWPHFVEQVCLPLAPNSRYVDLTELLRLLADRGLNDILLESGHTLAGAFIEQNLVDELILYQAPKLIGAEGKSLVTMSSLTQLDQAKKMTIKDVTMVGCDIRITAKFN